MSAKQVFINGSVGSTGTDDVTMSKRMASAQCMRGCALSEDDEDIEVIQNHARILVWICALLLIVNVLLVSFIGVGSFYAYRTVSGLSGSVDQIADTVTNIQNTFANITSNFQILPANVFDTATRIFTFNYSGLAASIAQAASVFTNQPEPVSGSVTGNIYSIADIVSQFATSVTSFPRIPNPNPQYEGPVDAVDFTIFQMLAWVGNQTDTQSMQTAGATCLALLEQVQQQIAVGSFQFSYACPNNVEHTHEQPYWPYQWSEDDDSTWGTCEVNITPQSSASYVGQQSVAWQVCQQLNAIITASKNSATMP